MERKNELAIIRIGGHNFHFEAAGFRDSEPPFNLLPYERMDSVLLKTSRNRVKRFMYDSDKKCIADMSSLKYPLPKSIQYMEVPDVFDKVRDEFMAEVMLEVMKSKPPGIYNDGTVFKARAMALTNIFGTSFIVDTQNLELLESLNRANKISFDHLTITEGNNKIFFDYNVRTRNIAAPTDDQDIIAIAILPSLDKLDPQGYELLISTSVASVDLPTIESTSKKLSVENPKKRTGKKLR